MFYPVESLKRGGRFYLCWVADSWPLRFAAITRRQLWSQDIRELCDELLEVVTMESGRPANRFSLRLSSQLMRGLVRLYEKKAAVLMSDLCMISANVFKSMNRRQAHQAERAVRRPPPAGARAAPAREPTRQEELDEQRLDEMIQNSGNIVANIQDITLKEMAIPEFRLPPNDNFGEENPDQALQLLVSRTPEAMLRDGAAAHTSALLAPPFDLSHDQSHDKSRAKHDRPAMESIGELDLTLFRKSNVADLQPSFEKDVPEIPEVLPPELPAPTEPIPSQAPMEVEQQVPEVVEIPAPPPALREEQPAVTAREQPAGLAPGELPAGEQPAPAGPAPGTKEKETETDTELEELEPRPARRRKRRARTSLIVDKRTKIDSDAFRARVDNPYVEMRFLDFMDAIIDIRPTAHILMTRLARAGSGLYSAISPRLTRLLQRNLGLATHREEQEYQMEQLRDRRARSSEQVLEKIPEVEEPQPAIELAVLPPSMAEVTKVSEGQEPMEVTTEMLNVTAPPLDVSALNVLGEVPNVADPNQMQVDISDLPTQKLETLSQVARKRTSEYESSAKKQRPMGYISFRESQQRSLQIPEIIIDAPDKENIPPNIQEQTEPTVTTQPPIRQRRSSIPLQQPIVLLEKLSIPHHLSLARVEPLAPVEQTLAPVEQPLAPIEEPLAPVEQPLAPIEQPLALIECSQAEATRMLQEAGLSDMQPPTVPRTSQRESESRKRRSSESSETQLGSLDRTKVSLGDSDNTTETQRFIRNEWGIEGTMTKLLFVLRARAAGGAGGAVHVAGLVRRGPVLAGCRRLVAARCFTSLLKLKQHGFIRVTKDPTTLEITDITLGPRFDNM